jgi:gliding motility-associated-like protein
VVNQVNGCWALADYKVPLIVDSVYLSTSTYPLTFCKSNNGEAFATTVNDSKFNYDFYWNTGASVDTVSNYVNPEGKVNDYKNLPAGIYTVIAADKRDRSCVSKPKTVKIQDMRVTPVATAQLLKALTVCDTTMNKPDGVAYASVGGDVVDYTFKWYVGAPVDTATVQSFNTGASATGLMNLTYTVYAISTSTGCADSTTVSIPTNFAKVPTPIVAVVSNKTSCVDNNGALLASVGGNTKDYVFYWDNGNNTPTPKNYDYEGVIYDSLDVGDYTVVADSRLTGCVSDPAKGTIINEQTMPKLGFIIQDATCQDNNGSLTVVVNSNGIGIASITWSQDGVTKENGPNLQQASAGDYSVTVVTVLGCETTQDVALPVDIKVYNGVSRNGDGKNDIFQISCIENFPTNRVEIFNRNGTKVYEANGYNNADVLFDGKSNRGISVMGNNLPPGTYFYIIYKNDGSKPVVGYLELVD